MVDGRINVRAVLGIVFSNQQLSSQNLITVKIEICTGSQRKIDNFSQASLLNHSKWKVYKYFSLIIP
jgi:hypothetical protein